MGFLEFGFFQSSLSLCLSRTLILFLFSYVFITFAASLFTFLQFSVCVLLLICCFVCVAARQFVRLDTLIFVFSSYCISIDVSSSVGFNLSSISLLILFQVTAGMSRKSFRVFFFIIPKNNSFSMLN